MMVAVPVAGFGVAWAKTAYEPDRYLSCRQHGRIQSCVEKKTSKGLSFTYSFNLIADTNYVKTLDQKQVRQYLLAVGDEASAVDSRTVEELDDELDA